MTLGDTDFFIDLMQPSKERHPRAVQRSTALEADGETVYMSAVTRFELFTGAEQYFSPPRERQRVERLLASFPALPLTPSAADRAGRLHGSLRRTGYSMGTLDAMIAAIALEQGESVLTRNLKDFSKVPDLRLESY